MNDPEDFFFAHSSPLLYYILDSIFLSSLMNLLFVYSLVIGNTSHLPTVIVWAQADMWSLGSETPVQYVLENKLSFNSWKFVEIIKKI